MPNQVQPLMPKDGSNLEDFNAPVYEALKWIPVGVRLQGKKCAVDGTGLNGHLKIYQKMKKQKMENYHARLLLE